MTPTIGTTALRVPARVLIVGLSDGDRDALRKAVLQEGHVPDVAGQAGEALGKLRTARIDVVLLDAHLSGTDGPSFLAALRNDPEHALVPVVVVAPAADLDGIARCLDDGADDWLPGEFRPAMLRARLMAALDRKRLRDTRSIRREMEVARNIQRDFLPESLPMAMGVQLEATLQPARQVSGDFYDAFMLAPSGTIVVVVGDVCDKGVGAALFMALFRSLIRASADPVGGGAIQMIGGRRTIVRQQLEAASPADLLTRVAGFTNDYIARLHGRTNMFATVFMAALDSMSGDFVYVNAGHEPALVLAPDGAILQELRPTGPALGLMPDQVFGSGAGAIEHGQCLFAFTDGLMEARSPAGEVFGAERLRHTLRAHGTNPKNLVRGVIETLNAFAGQAEPHDDLTLLAATRTI
jgi:sigma-B regulation protein RsbU (phosphoserine phosphatase)